MKREAAESYEAFLFWGRSSENYEMYECAAIKHLAALQVNLPNLFSRAGT